MINFTHHLAKLFSRVALAAALAATCGAASAGVIHVSVDTSTFGVDSGYLDMNLSASDGVPLVTATVDHLVGFGNVTSVDSWGVAAIPGGYVFRNDTSNDLFQGLDFGAVLSFDLTFAGAVDPVGSYITQFVLSAYAPDMVTPLGQFDPFTGAVAGFSWMPAAGAGQEGSVGISVFDAAVTAVPEPGDLLLVGAGLAALVLVRRRRGAGLALPA